MKPQVKRRAHNWYALKPNKALKPESKERKVTA